MRQGIVTGLHNLQFNFDELIQEYGPLLSRVASSYEADPDMRQELLQEISLAVWQAMEKFAGNSSIKTYVLRVAHNKAVTHVAYYAKQPYRESYCEVDAPIPSNARTQQETAEQQRQIDVLLKEIRQLSIQSRQIVTMSMEGLSYQEIAQVCGLNVSNVGVILTRAKKTLQERLANV